MANTYSQLYTHVVFAVAGRQALIPAAHKQELHRYVSGIVANKNCKLLVMNGMLDHVHLLLSIRPDLALADLVRDIKANSSRFIKEKRWATGVFAWQHGYGAFSVSASQVSTVGTYIENQEQHHAQRSFRAEYLGLLAKYEVEFDPQYIFQEI